MLAFRTDDPKSCGILELDQEELCGHSTRRSRTPPGNLANAAVYILEPEVVDYGVALSKPVVDFQTEIIPAFLNRIYAVEHNGYHRDIGSLESLRRHKSSSPWQFLPSANNRGNASARTLSDPRRLTQSRAGQIRSRTEGSVRPRRSPAQLSCKACMVLIL